MASHWSFDSLAQGFDSLARDFNLVVSASIRPQQASKQQARGRSKQALGRSNEGGWSRGRSGARSRRRGCRRGRQLARGAGRVRGSGSSRQAMQVATASDRDEEEDASISPTGGPRSNGARWTVSYHIHIPPTKHQNRTAPTLQLNIRWNHSIPKIRNGSVPFYLLSNQTLPK